MPNRLILVVSALCLLASAASADQQPVGTGSAARVDVNIVPPTGEGLLLPYDKLLIETLDVSYDSASLYQTLKPEHLARLNEAASLAIRTAVGERFTLVSEPGLGVLRLHAAISEIRAEEKQKRFFSYTPFGLVKRRIDRATGRNFVLLSATVKVQLFDSVSGQRLAAVTAPVDGSKGTRSNDGDLSFRTLVAKLGGLTQRLVSEFTKPDSRSARAQ